MKYCYEYPRPCVTVDIVVFKKTDAGLMVLLILRKNPPFQGEWALPGGFVDMDEMTHEAAVRELKEETGLGNIPIAQFHAFDAIDRDPRARTIAIAYLGFATDDHEEVSGQDDALEAGWFHIENLPKLAFDHKKIIEKALWFISKP